MRYTLSVVLALESQVCGREEVEQFASTLEPHQLAQLPDGSTVLAKAVMQHNILSASKLYFNISMTQLASLLGVDADKAESITAEMIFEGRLKGYIDQVRLRSLVGAVSRCMAVVLGQGLCLFFECR